MSWRDREWAGGAFGRPGGDWRGMRPSFDNPLTWSIPLGRVAGISVRLHLLFLLFIVIRLARAVSVDRGDPMPMVLGMTALMLAVLFGLVLLHEFGHALACRRVGGVADEILLWPLGGLAFCHPPNAWRAHFITAAGGPAVNVVACLLLAPTLGLLTGEWVGVAWPNPVDPSALWELPVGGSILLQMLYLANWLSLVLLLFNLLPIFPLDGSRLLQALLWARVGYVRSMRWTVRAGYVGAILLFVFGAVLGSVLICAIAIFGGVTSYITHRQLEFTEETMGFEDDEYALTFYDAPGDGGAVGTASEPSSLARWREERRASREAAAREEVDRILEKIQREGLESLNRRERRILREETERKRKHG